MSSELNQAVGAIMQAQQSLLRLLPDAAGEVKTWTSVEKVQVAHPGVKTMPKVIGIQITARWMRSSPQSDRLVLDVPAARELAKQLIEALCLV